jgi:hypothetical protein
LKLATVRPTFDNGNPFRGYVFIVTCVLSFYRRQIFQLPAKRLTVAAHSSALTHSVWADSIHEGVVCLESEIDHKAVDKVIIIRLANTKNEESLISLTFKSLSTFLSK